MINGVNFNGRRIVHPGAYDAIDASAMTITTGGSVNIPVVVGTANAGESGKLNWFTSVEDARRVLGGGELVTALELMFSPTPEGGGGASLVGVVVANQTVKAKATAGALTISAKEFGEGGNRINIDLADGTIAGSKKLTAYRWDTEQLETYDNLGAIIKVEYTGTEAVAEMTITKANDKANLLEIKIGADSATAVTDVAVDLTNERFGTVDAVIKYLNSVSGYKASYVEYRNSDMPSSLFDEAIAVDVKTANYVMGVKGDLLQLNNYSSLITIEVGTGAVSNFLGTYLTGGAKGDAPASWAPYFETIKSNFTDILVVLTASESIHAEASTHVGQMEIRHQKQMLFTGGGIGENVERTKQRASTLNSSRAVLAYPGIYSKSSGNKLLPSYFTAALIAGRVAGVPVSEPITFDYFNLVSLERDLLAGDPEIDDLISSGVAVLEKVQNGGIRLVQGITTYTSANNTLYREISVRRGADNLSSVMRKTMEDTFVGKKGLRATKSAVETKAIDVLEQAIKDGEITAYRNIMVKFQGTVVSVDYEVAPVEPINFVLVTSRFVPDSSFATN